MLELVIRHGLKVVGFGLLLGVASALAAGRLVTAFLYQVPPHDVLSLGSVLLGLAGGAVLAMAVPAWRATKVEPIDAMRIPGKI